MSPLLRPSTYGCQGALSVMQGVALASQASATGLTMSGVPAAITMSTPSLLMRSAAALPALAESLSASLTMISTPYGFPPIWIGLAAKYSVM